ncbi:hypothetical protein [Pedobacter cryotolerans]|uniref:Lipocalin-like domain-containing protein n=1 Tax=Pedobacter cryotolerans TaxID=2571270 RepID=A0A4U1C312_9SPHI|nr:hypothetical protein [Pedobacter cryotolerans]TKB99455.1 hypothetical protein FA045_13320 [Pedobacter cryotolerans]
MKSLFTLLIICIWATSVRAQEVNFKTIEGTWDYKSPKGKTKMSYKFEEDNKFTSVTERKETETLLDGSYTFDKIGDLDRLIISHIPKENGTKTITSYYLIKFSGIDTIKTQHVNGKQLNWLRETPKSTMVFVRKKDEAKK